MNKMKIATLIMLAFPIAVQASSEELTLNDLTSSNIAKLQKYKAENQVEGLRAEAIKSIALKLGVSAGLASQFKIYEKEIENKSAELDKIYDFERIKLAAGVLPPVLTQGFSNYVKEDDNSVSISDKNFKIESPARFVSVYPTWRDYLKLNVQVADIPSANFMPKTSGEKRLWDSAVKEGWEIGQRQAVEQWNSSYARLDRDYKGMILYKTLLAEGYITPAIVASANLGVTGDGTQMSVNHRVLRITNPAQFKTGESAQKLDYPATYKSVSGKIY